MKSNILIAVVFVLLAAGSIWYLQNQSQPAAEPATEKTGSSSGAGLMVPASGSSGVPEMVVENGTQTVTLEATEFAFQPKTLRVKKGQTVTLTLKNMGKMPHDWVVDELGARTKVIASGDMDTIEFTPQQAGTFEYYCSVGLHRANGMVGKITVTE